jgi:hypothetical protein
MKSRTRFKSRSWIPNKFIFEGWNCEKKYQFWKLAKKIAIKIMRIKFDRTKNYGRWNCKNKSQTK